MKLKKNKIYDSNIMPRPNTVERKFACELCDKSYSFQSGLCNHIRLKHPELYAEKISKRLSSRTRTVTPPLDDDPGLSLPTPENPSFDLKELMENCDYMRDRFKQGEYLDLPLWANYLEQGKLAKNLAVTLASFLRGSVRISNGFVASGDFNAPVSDDIFKPLVRNFIRAVYTDIFSDLKSYMMDGKAIGNDAMKNVYEIYQMYEKLDEELPFLTLEFRKLAEKVLRA